MKTTREISKALFGVGLVLLPIFTFPGQAVSQSLPECLQSHAGLVSWWSGDGNANDFIGANHGTLKNGATFAPGLVAQAFSFDGVDDFVEVPDSHLWAFGTSNFTIEMWVNFESVKSSTIGHPQVVFIGNDEGPGIQNKWTFAFGGGVLYWLIASPTLGPIFMVLAPFSPIVHQWYHLAVIRDGSTYTIFVDGTSVGSYTNTDAVPDANVPLTIGQSEGNFFMHGRIDELAIYSHALSATEIQAIFNASSVGKCKIISMPPDQCQQNLAEAEEQIQEIQDQVDALTTQNAQLQQQLQTLQSQMAQLNSVLVGGLSSLQKDFQAMFNSPTFVIPGATALEQYQHLISAVLNLNKGRKEGLYVNLGGKPGK